VLIETDPDREESVWAQPHEHPAPLAIVHGLIVLDDPALGQLQVPPVVLLAPIAVTTRAGSRALRTMTTGPGLPRLKHGSAN
jgi:hypothetical protein